MIKKRFIDDVLNGPLFVKFIRFVPRNKGLCMYVGLFKAPITPLNVVINILILIILFMSIIFKNTHIFYHLPIPNSIATSYYNYY